MPNSNPDELLRAMKDVDQLHKLELENAELKLKVEYLEKKLEQIESACETIEKICEW